MLAREGTLVRPLLTGVAIEPATVGMAALAAALLVEHRMGVAFSRRP